jgi:phage baseplate assembly protein V
MSAIGDLLNAQRQHQSNGSTYPRKGTISSYDKDSYSVKVLIQPEDLETGWIQLDAHGVGNGWGVVVGPQIGDEVEVSFDNGDPNLGCVTGRYFNDTNTPPPVPSGETWIVHSTGSVLKFNNDGTVTLSAVAALGVHSGVAINYNAPQHNFTGGPVAMDHKLTVTDADGIEVVGGDVKADLITLKTHRTSGVTAGSGTSGAPVV